MVVEGLIVVGIVFYYGGALDSTLIYLLLPPEPEFRVVLSQMEVAPVLHEHHLRRGEALPPWTRILSRRDRVLFVARLPLRCLLFHELFAGEQHVLYLRARVRPSVLEQKSLFVDIVHDTFEELHA